MRTLPTTMTALALVLGLQLSGCTPSEESAQRAREEYGAALQRRDRPAALAAVARLRDASPDSPEAAIEVATLLASAGESRGAIWELEAARRRFPERQDLRLALGLLALRTQDGALAKRTLATIPEGADEHAAALIGLAQAELLLGDADAGLAWLERAETLYPERPEARARRLATLMEEDRFDAARALAEEMAGEAQSDAERQQIGVLIAQIQKAQGELEQAQKTLRDLVAEQPGAVAAWIELVRVSAQTGAVAETRDALMQALSQRPEDAALKGVLAELQRGLGELDAAEDLLRSLVDETPTPPAYAALAEFYARAARPEDARAALAEAIAAHPDVRALRLLQTEVLLDLGRVEDAGREAAVFLAEEPEASPERSYVEGRLALARGELDRARSALASAASGLDSATAQYWLGEALERGGDAEGAARRYSLAHQRAPGEIAPVRALLRFAQRSGDWARVVHFSGVLARLAPDAETYQSILEGLVQLDQLDAAEQVVRGLAAASPEDAQWQLWLARVLRLRGQLAEAEAALPAADEPDETPEITAERARIRGARGDAAGGLALVSEGLASHPDAPMLHLARGELAFQAGDTATGSAALERVLALAPQDPRPLRLRARLLAEAGQPVEARSDLARYLESFSRDADAHFQLGLVHAQLGDADAAAASYRRAVALDATHAAARNNLALALAERGELEEAARLAQEAYRLAGSVPQVVDTLGWIYLKRGLAERAVALLEQAHESDPELDEVRYHLALAYQAVARPDDARRLLEELRSRVEESDRLYAQAGEALRALE